MMRSRRSKRLQKKTKRNIVLTLIGIFLVLFLIAKFGIPAIANFAIFVSGFRTANETQQKGSSFVQPPILNALPSATNSSELEISGSAAREGTVQLYLNDNLVNAAKVNEDGSFKFLQTIDSKDNQIKTRVNVDGKKSDFSDIFTVTFIGSAPSLTIDTPADGDNFSKDQKTVSVSGKVDSGVTVTVNGFWAIVDESNNYSYILPLKNGDNEITVVATDIAKNKTEKTIKVSFAE